MKALSCRFGQRRQERQCRGRAAGAGGECCDCCDRCADCWDHDDSIFVFGFDISLSSIDRQGLNESNNEQ